MRRFLSWGIVGIAIAVIAVSCGGRIVDGGGTGGAAGAGSGTGGTTSTGTTVGGTTTGTGGTTGGGTTAGGTGGTTVGGTTVGGTTTGTGGTGAKGGTGGTAGSGGTGGDPGADFGSCTGPGQCELAVKKCCSCDTLGLDQLEPINAAKRDAYRKQACSNMPQPCPPCVGTIEPHLMARCEAGRCVGLDVRKEPAYTKCGSNQECILRPGLACCACLSPGPWVSLSYVGNMVFSADVCVPGTVCPTCPPIPPNGATSVCLNNICETIP